MSIPVEVAGLTKLFRDFWHREKVRAVQDLTFTINEGEVFGLLGPNASGKTTTIKLLLGLLVPTSGRVRIFGLHPRSVRVKSRIGFLPEESYFYKYLNASEAMDFYGRLFGLRRVERKKRSETLLKRFGLLPSRKRPIGEYSKGMARRIGLAQALINDPELLVLDEPTSGLDPIGRKEVKDLILELKKLGKTVLLSSHLLADVEDVCDRIGILYEGKLIAEGEVDKLLAKEGASQVVISGMSSERIEQFVETLRSEADEVKVSGVRGKLEDFFLETLKKTKNQEGGKH